jgi:hypothetical protein
MEYPHSATVSWNIRFRRNPFDKIGHLRYDLFTIIPFLIIAAAVGVALIG